MATLKGASLRGAITFGVDCIAGWYPLGVFSPRVLGCVSLPGNDTLKVPALIGPVPLLPVLASLFSPPSTISQPRLCLLSTIKTVPPPPLFVLQPSNRDHPQRRKLKVGHLFPPCQDPSRIRFFPIASIRFNSMLRFNRFVAQFDLSLCRISLFLLLLFNYYYYDARDFSCSNDRRIISNDRSFKYLFIYKGKINTVSTVSKLISFLILYFLELKLNIISKLSVPRD